MSPSKPSLAPTFTIIPQTDTRSYTVRHTPDYLTSRAANPHTGLISPSIGTTSPSIASVNAWLERKIEYPRVRGSTIIDGVVTREDESTTNVDLRREIVARKTRWWKKWKGGLGSYKSYAERTGLGLEVVAKVASHDSGVGKRRRLPIIGDAAAVQGKVAGAAGGIDMRQDRTFSTTTGDDVLIPLRRGSPAHRVISEPIAGIALANDVAGGVVSMSSGVSRSWGSLSLRRLPSVRLVHPTMAAVPKMRPPSRLREHFVSEDNEDQSIPLTEQQWSPILLIYRGYASLGVVGLQVARCVLKGMDSTGFRAIFDHNTPAEVRAVLAVELMTRLWRVLVVATALLCLWQVVTAAIGLLRAVLLPIRIIVAASMWLFDI